MGEMLVEHETITQGSAESGKPKRDLRPRHTLRAWGNRRRTPKRDEIIFWLMTI